MRKIVDVWMQHPTPDFLRNDFFSSILGWMGWDSVPDQIPLQSTIEQYDSAEVSHALVSAWWGPSGPIISNEEVAKWVAQYPDRLMGVCSANLLRPMEAIAEISKCVEQQNFKAVRIVPWLWDLPPNDRHYYPIYAECVRLDVPICLQVGHTGPMMRSEPGRPIPYLDDVAHDFPELRIVAGHIGFPWTAEMISLATKYPNVYIDTSAYKPKRYPSEIVEFIKQRGSRKVMFGTNFPMVSPVDCMNELALLGLDDECSERFLWSNAAKVFKL
jgi:predicted TIM-barrel fold metal-dependent hydrolase